MIFLRDLRAILANSGREPDRSLVAFASGYLISRIGSGEKDLRLADSFQSDAPEVLAWATMIGGLGGAPYWTDAFGGLGRLVARELLRPVHLEDPPAADVSFEELQVVVEPDRPSTKNRVRTGHRNAASVSLFPGVVVPVALQEEEREKSPTQGSLLLPSPPIHDQAYPQIPRARTFSVFEAAASGI